MSQAINNLLTANSPTVSGTLVVSDNLTASGSVTALASMVIAGNAGNKGFLPFQVNSITAYVSSSALGNVVSMSVGDCGVCTLSGSGAVLTVIAPLASACPGGEFILRSLDARAHVITSSLETAGKKVFAGAHLSASQGSQLYIQANGSKLTFDGNIGTSVTFWSDGNSWITTPGSGSVVLS